MMETVTRKRLLYKSKVEYMSGAGTYTMNIAEGCAHGCKYPCYAFSAAMRYGSASSYQQWLDAKPVENAVELLRSELGRKRREPVERIHMCFTTDPFMRGRADIKELALECIAEANAHGVPVTVLTKGIIDPKGKSGLVLRGHPDNELGITLVSVHDGFRQEFEPYASPTNSRIWSLETAHALGIRTWASLEPFPALTKDGLLRRYGKDDPEWVRLPAIGLDGCPDDEYDALREVLSALDFVDRLVFGRWNYNAKMPTDMADTRGWYRGAAQIVRRFCAANNIGCHIKEGTE